MSHEAGGNDDSIWNDGKEQRFHELQHKKSQGTLTQQEKNELNDLYQHWLWYTKGGRESARGAGNLAKTPVGRSGNVMKVLTKNSPTTIGGRKFTGHALDQMQSRGILSPRAVLDVIKNPARTFPGNTPGTSVFIRDNLKVITNKAGDIITVIPQ